MTAAQDRWTTASIPDQSGRTVVVTGANSGLGLQTATAMAGAGAHVVLAVRDRGRGEAAAAGIDGDTEVRELDLADLDSVHAFADGWSGDLDVLVCNAGVMAVPESRTPQGFERQIGTNHLGHFALTCLLAPHLTDRVVVVSSALHRRGRIDLDDLCWERRAYEPWPAYAQSKLANLLFVLGLEHRLRGDARGRRATAAHPGYAATNLQGRTGHRLGDLAAKVGNVVLAQSDAAGALPTIFAAVEDLPSGSYAGPDGLGEQRGGPTLVGRSRRASDAGVTADLWTLSEHLTGTSWDPA